MFSLFDLKHTLYKIYPKGKKKATYFEITLRAWLKPTGAKELRLGLGTSAPVCLADPEVAQWGHGETHQGVHLLWPAVLRAGHMEPQRKEEDRRAKTILVCSCFFLISANTINLVGLWSQLVWACAKNSGWISFYHHPNHLFNKYSLSVNQEPPPS